MNRIEDLITALEGLVNHPYHDQEVDHVKADRLLLEYINNPRVTDLYSQLEKWYA